MLERKYAQHVGEIIEQVRRKEGREIGAFIAEMLLPSVAGQIVFPINYLKEAYLQVRAAGGVCIADEECRSDSDNWGRISGGFETQGAVRGHRGAGQAHW